MASSRMQEGKADIFFDVATIGHPTISELSITTELVFLPIDDDIIQKLSDRGLTKTILPAKTFKGRIKISLRSAHRHYWVRTRTFLRILPIW